ncbi:MAG: glycine cleavage system aminomethyltransferase GcvT [Solirubrobacterales bacterium]|nr:glycine cleavage system aminomethyltransferase GcvT [Solirubrobacterales bacterium]
MTLDPGLRRTPLYETHLEAEAKIVPFAGWEMPVFYDGIKEEHIAVRTHAGIFDVSHMGRIEIEGRGSLAFLQRLLSNDAARLEEGEAQYTLLLNEQAGILDDLLLYRIGGDRYLVVTNAGNHADDLARFGQIAREFDVYVRDVSLDYVMLAIQGRHARRTIESQLRIELPPRMGLTVQRVGGRPAFVCGTGYTGEDGVELMIDPDVGPAVWSELVDAGVVPCGLGSRDTLRLEACFPLHGNDIGPETDPISTGLGWACVEATGFIGSDRVAELRRQGTGRRLVPFLIEGDGIPRPGNPVIFNEEVVGEVTSGTFSPSLERGIGMAYIESGAAGQGTAIEIDVRGKRRDARVSSKPLYPKER